MGDEALKDDWEANHSSGGKYLVLNYVRKADIKPPSIGSRKEQKQLTLAEIGGVDVQVAWVDLNSLDVLKAWTTNTSSDFPQIISDAGVALSWAKIGRPDGPWSPLCRTFYCNIGSRRFVNSTTIISAGNDPIAPRSGRRWVSFINTEGEVLFHETFAPKEIFRFPLATASFDGRRIALAVFKGQGGSEFFDVGPRYPLDRIIVFDVPSLRWTYALDAKKLKIPNVSGIALSPDGSLLGIITENGILQVFRLPR
jgi:hypothetical protein